MTYSRRRRNPLKWMPARSSPNTYSPSIGGRGESPSHEWGVSGHSGFRAPRRLSCVHHSVHQGISVDWPIWENTSTGIRTHGSLDLLDSPGSRWLKGGLMLYEGCTAVKKNWGGKSFPYSLCCCCCVYASALVLLFIPQRENGCHLQSRTERKQNCSNMLLMKHLLSWAS